MDVLIECECVNVNFVECDIDIDDDGLPLKDFVLDSLEKIVDTDMDGTVLPENVMIACS